MNLTSLTTALSDVSASSILIFCIVFTVLRLGLIKARSNAARASFELVEAALIVAPLVFLIIQPFIIKAFYIPSGSMRPGLINNDHILVNRFIYRFHPPQHDQVVVFKAPPEALETGGEPPGSDEDYIKRLIGLPGDSIKVVGGTITINGIAYSHNDVRPYYGLGVGISQQAQESKDRQHLKFTSTGISVYDGTKWTNFSASDVAMKISGSASAKIVISPGYVIRNGKRLNEPFIAEDPDYNLKVLADGEVLTTEFSDGATRLDGQILNPADAVRLINSPSGVIPAGKLFVMGDNRNDSNDSTFWGPLDKDQLVGQAVCIFYPFNRVSAIR